jgi:manganese efflux pump family protein
VVELLLVAAAVGLGNFAAAIGIGISGVDARVRIRVGLVFGGFETAMPILGLLLGRRIAGPLGSKASLLGGALLIATGLFGLFQARRAHGKEGATLEMPMRRLLLVGAALSIDNLVVGLALGTSGTSLVEAVLTIGVVSVAMTLLGLELGSRLGSRFEQWAGELGAAVLVVVGIVVAAGVL